MLKLIQQTLQTNSTLIELIDKIIFHLHTQNYDKALRISAVLLRHMDAGMGQLQAVTDEERILELNGILEGIFLTQNSKDYVLQADLYELQLRRYFIRLQEDIISMDDFTYGDSVFESNRAIIHQADPELCELIYQGGLPFGLAEQGYEAEFSSCGLMTLALTDAVGRYYMHSNSRVSKEAFTLASSWYEDDITHYVLYGFGLGYHVRELARLDDSVQIDVYEADINILKLAAAYTDIGVLMNNHSVRIIYDPSHIQMLHRLKDLKEEERFIIHSPSLRNVKYQNIKERMENYFVQYSSIANQKNLLKGNFRENMTNYDGFAEELRERFVNKDLYIIAAGPSLDKNYHLLKKVDRSKGIILATGTVYRKLLTAGIRPDYVIVSDATEYVYAQMEGLEAESVPMLYLSTAYKRLARNYHGRKYIILQKDFGRAEDFAKKHNVMLNSTGGSVSTTALDLGISLGCGRIIFLGLDLAYTDNYIHASDTSLRYLEPSQDLRVVPDIHGNPVHTGKTFDIYRQWIEKRIHDVREIEFIDATEGGARIAGMKCLAMEECIRRFS